MNKKTKIKIVLSILIVIGYIAFHQWRETTYEEVVTNLMGEDEKVEEIILSTNLGLLKKTATSKIDKEKTINNILDAKIKLQKEVTFYRNPPILDNTLLIKTNKNSYQIGFDEGSITVGNKLYFTVNPVVNPIYMLILKEDLKWEISQYIETPPK